MRARIAALLDYATGVFLILAASTAAFGGFRTRVGDLRLSFHSPGRLLLMAVALIVVRHVLLRTPALHARVLAAFRRALASASLRAALPPWVLLRLGMIAIGFLAVVMVGYGPAELPFRWSDDDFVNLQARWDAGWYVGIATEGYQWSPEVKGQQNIAFMPALPMTVRAVARLLGRDWTRAGWIVSLALPLLALGYFYRLARQLGLDEPARRRALVLFAAYPFAVFHGAIYTEALFTLGVTAAMLYQLRGSYAAATAFAVLVGLSRPNGFLLSVPLGLLAIRTHLGPGRWNPMAVPVGTWLRAALPAAGAVAGLAAFCAFAWRLTGDPLAWLHTHAAWGRSYSPIINLVKYPWLFVQQHGLVAFVQQDPMHVLNGLAALLALAAVWPCYRRFGLAYAAFILVNLLPPMFAGGLLSIGRLTSTLFPVFLWLAVALPEKWAWPLVGLFGAGQALGAALFYTWRQFL